MSELWVRELCYFVGLVTGGFIVWAHIKIRSRSSDSGSHAKHRDV